MNVIFFGSAAFSVPALAALIKSNITIPLVVTVPDKPAGRGMKLQGTPIKEFALEHGLNVTTELPKAIDLKKYAPDHVIVVAYGKFLPDELVNTYSCINIHPSLLPKYRGPSPIQTALLNGDTETGVTTMMVSHDMDAGDILLQEKTTIDINEKYSELEQRLSQIGANLLVRTLDQDVPALRKKQDEKDVTFCRKITNEDGLIDWSKAPREIHNKVRAITAFTIVNGKRIKVLETRMNNDILEIVTVQPEGKKPMSYEEFRRGYKLELV